MPPAVPTALDPAALIELSVLAENPAAVAETRRWHGLDALEPGRSARVAAVALPGAMGDRLVELGFTLGAAVKVLRRAPFGGPLQVQVRDYVLTLRRGEAAGVAVLQT